MMNSNNRACFSWETPTTENIIFCSVYQIIHKLEQCLFFQQVFSVLTLSYQAYKAAREQQENHHCHK